MISWHHNTASSRFVLCILQVFAAHARPRFAAQRVHDVDFRYPSVGTIGHVAHGKSTVVKAISGVQTVRFKNELERNITIKLGYANAKIYKAKDPRVPRQGSLAGTECSCQCVIC